jgi:hypothetical protein
VGELRPRCSLLCARLLTQVVRLSRKETRAVTEAGAIRYHAQRWRR